MTYRKYSSVAATGSADLARSHKTSGLRSLSRLHLGRATSGASALALAFAFLAPKPAAAVPFFEDLTATKAPAEPGCATITGSKAGCYTSWLVATDLDSDGDMDVLFANGGGYYTPGVAEPSVVYLNDGVGNFSDATGPVFGGAVSRLRQVGVGDINGDGLKDILQPGGYKQDLDKVWIQGPAGVFTDKAADLLPAGLMSNTPGFHLGDLDGDGDLDLVTTDWYTSKDKTPVYLTLYLNDGTGKFTLEEEQQDPQYWLKSDHFPPTIPYVASQLEPYWGTRAIDLDFADIDNDFDLDIIVNMRNGVSRLFLNDGKGYFKDGTGKVTAVADPLVGSGVVYGGSNFPGKRGPYVYNQEVCDIDNDGDLDILLDNAGPKPTPTSTGDYTQLLINDGKGKFTDESRARIFGEPGYDDNAVKCVDLNNDGNYDMVVASLGRNEKLLMADGTGKFNYVPDGIPVVADSTLGIDAADFDGDGLFDIWTGQGEGGSYVDRYFHGIPALDPVTGAQVGAQVDTRPPVFRAIQKPVAVEGKPIKVRVAVKDSVTSETGDMVKDVSIVYTTIGSNLPTPGGKLKATFVGGDLFQAEIPAQDAYTVVTITPQATDRRNLKTYATPITITVKAEGDVGGGGTGGTGGTAGTGGTGGGTAGTAGTGGTSTSEGGEGGEPGGGTAGVGGEPTSEAGSGGTSTEPTGGTGGDEPTAGTTTGATGGSGGTGAAPSEGGEPAEGGAPGTAGTGTSSGPADDGCSVSSSASSTGSSGSWLAALGLALMAGRRRKRGQ